MSIRSSPVDSWAKKIEIGAPENLKGVCPPCVRIQAKTHLRVGQSDRTEFRERWLRGFLLCREPRGHVRV